MVSRCWPSSEKEGLAAAVLDASVDEVEIERQPLVRRWQGEGFVQDPEEAFAHLLLRLPTLGVVPLDLGNDDPLALFQEGRERHRVLSVSHRSTRPRRRCLRTPIIAWR